MNHVRIFFHQAWLDYKSRHAQLNWEEILFYNLSVPLLTLVYFCVIARHSFNTDALGAWVVGNAILLCTNTCVFDLGGVFDAEREYGRLRWLVASPYSRLALVLQKGLLFIGEGFVTAALGLVFGGLLFGVSFAGVRFGWFALILAVGMLSAICFGMFISVFGLLTDSMHLILNLVNVAMLILCGANFPVARLPVAARALSRVLPFTRSIAAGQMLFGQADGACLVALLGQELVVGAVYLVLAAALFKGIERVAVRRALLEIF